ncbi:MAG: porin [Micavibrio sp.]|nr:MAG: porin [Micavibrio sp.]
MIKKTLLLSSAALLVTLASPAAAQQMTMEQMQKELMKLSGQVQTLSTKVEQQGQVIRQQDAQIASQKAELQEQGEEQAAVADTLANISPTAGGTNSGVKISMKPMPKIESADGKYSFQPFGRVHLDATHFDDDTKDHASNANFRRTRLGMKGNLGEDFKYKSEIDFAEEGVNFKEVTLTYTGIEAADIKVGHQKPAFGMEQNTSSNYIQFVERSAPTNAFTRDEEIGVNVLAGGSNWSLGGGVFNEDAGNDDTGEDEDITVDVRGSVNILGFANNVGDNVLHLGGGISHRYPTGSVRFSAKPAGDGDRVIDTGSFASVDSVHVYGAEAAGVFGPVSIQGEYFMADVSRARGMPDAEFDGYYAQAGWFLTGESRPYKGSTGNFSRVKPKNPLSRENGGFGAVELVARHSNTDLNDAGAGILGGELEQNSVGINWHLTDHIRLMGNVIDVNTDSNAVVADDDPTVFNTRAQWDF